MASHQAEEIPNAFIWRRLHSLAGLFFVLYLIEHLLVNSQAALMFGEDGAGFVKSVNKIHELPYLIYIEIFLLGVPILFHTVLGIRYLFTASPNSYGRVGNQVYLPEYSRNQAYTWQRITSWILLFAIAAHVIQMRIREYPLSAKEGRETSYMVRIKQDPGLSTLAERLGFQIYDQARIDKAKQEKHVESQQFQEQQAHWLEVLQQKPLKEGQVIAVSRSFGMAELLMLRETFKSPLMIALYTVLVLTACYHGFNGMWTFMIKWGITLTQRSQMLMRYFTTFLMILVAFWGLAAVWGTYWINLKH